MRNTTDLIVEDLRDVLEDLFNDDLVIARYYNSDDIAKRDINR